MSAKRVVILGSSGSVGRKAIEVAARYPDLFRVEGLAVNTDVATALAQAERVGAGKIVVADERAAEAARTSGISVFKGGKALAELAGDADLVVNAVVGRAGLEASFAAVRSGAVLALANKESLVLAGGYLMAEAEKYGAAVVPIDSEHSGLFQLLEGRAPETVRRLAITASGGPFRGKKASELHGVTPKEALNHPVWPMGPRITVDSATLFNKGMEVIETHHLFGTPFDAIHVYVHPQAVVHALIDFVDGSSLAQLSVPDMLTPIQYAMTYPDRLPAPAPVLDLAACGSLTFEEPDLTAFPALSLAFNAGRTGGTAPTVMNAADEVAVEAFLTGKLSFTGIIGIIDSVLERVAPVPVDSLGAVDEADREARTRAREILGA